MRKVMGLAAGLLLSGCAASEYVGPGGIKLRRVTLLMQSRVEAMTVSTNGLTIVGAKSAGDARAIEAAAEGAAKGARGGL